ncbi:MAG: hypothetical protein HZA77_07170 [Candidatus Schekmanbacteria bacterium]|nr:hypothetical protein [Candidatus Schekmanbacteria bacterium]
MKKILISFMALTFVLSFCLPAIADEYSERSDETLHPFKVAAYAIYPAGYLLENLVVKPMHWIGHLPFIKDISGHEAFSNEGLWSNVEDEE